ncbi:MAG: MFS transporter [Planctomycetes bacterium]|nr:MFS transporter [Planctomycetota bacterium]
MPHAETNAGHGEGVSRAARLLVVITAFLGWLGAGLVMVLIPLAGRSANISFLGAGHEADVGNWFSRYICAFLLGAAVGGLLFGWLGDRIGRAKAMGLSIICYSVLTGLTYFVQSPSQLVILRFLACLGVGGMWPNGVSLASEAWANVSRPLLAGVIGTSANLGFMSLALVAMYQPITPENWRWVFLIGAAPVVLGIVVLLVVPESPQWLASARTPSIRLTHSPVAEVFRRPLLKYTMIGICLGMIPLLGNWGGANWLVPWAGQTGGEDDPYLKAWTQWSRSGGAALGALLGGWLASRFGRRTTYFLVSLASLLSSLFVFWTLTPGDEGFLPGVFVLGFFGTVYFGWLPLYLPELFPTRVRATGAGVTFNFGRIMTAFGVLGAGQLMVAFDGDYARVGQVTCMIYVLGMIIICFAPDTSECQLRE